MVVQFLVEGEDLSKDVKALGFPIEHKHKLCCLRQELIDSFVDARYMMFIKYAAYRLQLLNMIKNEDKTKGIENGSEKVEVPEPVNKPSEEDKEKVDNKEKEEEEKKKSQIQEDEAKKIVESIKDGTKAECKDKIPFLKI